MEPLANTLKEILAHRELFVDPDREDRVTATPPIVIIDDFYNDPDSIREKALGCAFVDYNPPDPDIVGPEVAATMPDRGQRWRSSAFTVFRGKPVERPFMGTRFAPDCLRERLEKVVGEPIDRDSWTTAGDDWNGAFHLIDGRPDPGNWSVHHHHKPGDIERGWSGLVYLSPDAPPQSGTTIWRDQQTGKCIAPYGPVFELAADRYEPAFLVENRYNRLVLFRENVLHRGEPGFGEGTAARLSQTFFFELAR